jgi:hypothetical protein
MAWLSAPIQRGIAMSGYRPVRNRKMLFPVPAVGAPAWYRLPELLRREIATKQAENCREPVANKYNPFRPDKMMPPGMFHGRVDELEFIDHCLLQTKKGNPQHFLIEGERGIGKSSLLLCEQFVAEGLIPLWGAPAS